MRPPKPAPVSAHRFAFAHSHVGTRFVLACFFCGKQYRSPKRRNLRMIEDTHRCPRMVRALGTSSGMVA